MAQREFFQFRRSTCVRVLSLRADVLARIKGIRIEENLKDRHGPPNGGVGVIVREYFVRVPRIDGCRELTGLRQPTTDSVHDSTRPDLRMTDSSERSALRDAILATGPAVLPGFSMGAFYARARWAVVVVVVHVPLTAILRLRRLIGIYLQTWPSSRSAPQRKSHLHPSFSCSGGYGTFRVARIPVK